MKYLQDKTNQKSVFYAELLLLFFNTKPIAKKKDGSKNSPIVAYAFVASGTCLPNCCLASIVGIHKKRSA
jgi:hypothetical protein